MSISGGLVGSYSSIGKTFILEDSDGNTINAVVVDQETIFTAGDNDVREGFVYAGDSGVSIGTKDIPIYRTRAGAKMISPHNNFSISIPEYNGYDYTVFQCMISLVNMDDFNNSVDTSMISIKDGVYETNSTIKLADVSKNIETQSIDLNIVNDSENYYFIHYFTYREED